MVYHHFHRISTRVFFSRLNKAAQQWTAQDLESDESDSEESDGSSEVSDIIPPPPKPQKSNGTGPRPVVPDSDDEVPCLVVSFPIFRTSIVESVYEASPTQKELRKPRKTKMAMENPL